MLWSPERRQNCFIFLKILEKSAFLLFLHPKWASEPYPVVKTPEIFKNRFFFNPVFQVSILAVKSAFGQFFSIFSKSLELLNTFSYLRRTMNAQSRDSRNAWKLGIFTKNGKKTKKRCFWRKIAFFYKKTIFNVFSPLLNQWDFVPWLPQRYGKYFIFFEKLENFGKKCWKGVFTPKMTIWTPPSSESTPIFSKIDFLKKLEYFHRWVGFRWSFWA